MLAGLLPQAELPLLAPSPEPPRPPEGEGEELGTEDKDKDKTDDEWTEDDGLGEVLGVSYTIEELEPKVVEGGVPGTEMVDEGLPTVPELEDPPVDPPVMVKFGEMLPELPITKLNR